MPEIAATPLPHSQPLAASIGAIEPILAGAYEAGNDTAVQVLHAVIALLDRVQRQVADH